MNLEWKYGSISLWSQWDAISRLGKGFNWVDFYIIHAGFEYEKRGPSFEVSLAVLGLGIRFSVAMPWKTEQSEELRKSLDEALNSKCMHCGKHPWKGESDEA